MENKPFKYPEGAWLMAEDNRTVLNFAIKFFENFKDIISYKFSFYP